MSLALVVAACPGAGAAADENANREAEAAIRANIEAFVQAYNHGNAQAIANLFTSEGQLIDENDHTTHGHDAIEHAFADVFKASPAGRIEVNVDSIRFFGSALAVETGTTKVVDKPGAEPDVTHYTVLHTKSLEGKWLMTFARDTSVSTDENTSSPSEPVASQGPTEAATQQGNFAKLKPLSWMIGNWIDEGEESVVISSCKWSPDKNFILQSVEVRREGHEALTMRQRHRLGPHRRPDAGVDLRFQRRLRRIVLDAGRQIVAHAQDGRSPGRHTIVVGRHFHADEQRLLHLAIDEPRGRQAEAAADRSQSRPQTARANEVSPILRRCSHVR